MRYAIVSDIHANRQAWEETLNDILKWGVDATVCLGDIVGYGPMPEPVLESVCEYADDIVIGNHDAVIGGRSSPELFGAHALKSLEWTQSRLDEASVRFLGDLPSLIEGDGFALAHAEVLDPEMFGYIENPTDARLNFESCSYPLVFVGHTHYPEIYALDMGTSAVQRIPCQDIVLASDHRYLINVGSVGDPRDGTREASYCIFDDEARTVVFRKLLFDLDGYRRDMADRKVEYKPYFVMAAAHPGARPPPKDWAMEMPARSHEAPKKPVRVLHVSQSAADRTERQEAEAEQERLKRERLLTALQQARAADEQRRKTQIENQREALRKRQQAMEQARARKEQERQRQAEENRRKSLEMLAQSKIREEERRKQQEAHAARLRETLEERKEIARKRAEVRRWKQEQERQEKERRLQARKAELAKAAEERRLRREAEQEAAQARIREALELKKRQMASPASATPSAGKSRAAHPLPVRDSAPPPPAAPVPSLHETREIVLRPKTDAGRALPGRVSEPAPAPPASPPADIGDTLKELTHAEPEERRSAIAELAAEKQRRRREADAARRQRAREAIRKKQEIARKNKGENA